MRSVWESVLWRLTAQNRLGQVQFGFATWGLAALSLLACGAGWSDAPSLGGLSFAFRWLVPLLITSLVLILVSITPGVGLPLFAAVMPYLGLIRREMIPLAGYSGNDPITLFSGFVVAGIMARLLIARQIRIDTFASKLMLPLLFVMFGQVLNPAQGGLVVGVAGAIFYFVPMLFFFVGRRYVTPEILERIFTVIVVSGCVCAAYGLYQSTFGFNEREWAWIEFARYRQQLFGIFRVFSTFLSFGEYVLFLAMALEIAWSRLMRRRWIYLPVALFLFATIFLSSSRSGVVSSLLAMVVVWAVLARNRRGWWLRGALAGSLALFGLLNTLRGVELGDVEDRNAFAVGYQASGLTDPLGEQSTGRMHLGLVAFGFTSGVTRPIGRGLGSTTVAAEKFGSEGDVHTEVDFTNFIVSTGVLGGLLYMALAITLIGRLIGFWLKSRSTVALSAVGVATVLLGNWTMGGYYAPSSLMWLILGGVDMCLRRLEMAEHESRRRPQVPSLAIEQPLSPGVGRA